jgi:protein ImuA
MNILPCLMPESRHSSLLSRRSHRQKPGLPFLGGLTLAPSRVHEFCGPARRTLALMLAEKLLGSTDQPLFWLAPEWQRDRLHGEAVTRFINPGRITFINPKRPEDLLWSCEEILRSGLVSLMVCELPAHPNLTAVRRMHLAAETAAREHNTTPVGLLLMAGQGGIQGVESRWYMAPNHKAGDQRWQLERRRARMEPPKAWGVARRKDGVMLEGIAVEDCG